MKNIKIVIGANFGDEGKGLMTDYFSQRSDSIVVCSNGGAQRGHTVTRPDAIRHVFHHFGSGTFNGAATYLSEDYILNPIFFKKEYEELKSFGYTPTIYIDQRCMLTTPFDMMANQIIEQHRGKNKHGSCGLGIYETIKRYRAGITALDDRIREYYIKQFKKEKIILSDTWKKIFWDHGIIRHYLEDLDFMREHSVKVEDASLLNQYNNIVFEAAQGLLLDQNNAAYFPHLTPSNTGIANPKRIIEEIGWQDQIHIETCYVSRTYLTRHGAGRFPSECNKKMINENMIDQTNVANPYQDTLRYGTLDLNELHDRCFKDVGDFGDQRSIAITHCNEYSLNNRELQELFRDWNIYYADGETHQNIFADR